MSNVWLDYKGLQEFIKFSQNPEYQVVMVGVPEDLQKRLPKEILAIGRTSNQQELAAIYSLTDVFVNPTYNDSFPTVNLEALACGSPVVTYRTGGSPEAVDESTGMVVEQGDFDRLCAAIEVVRKNGKAHYSTACRKRAEECFDKEKCFEKYIELYKELI